MFPIWCQFNRTWLKVWLTRTQQKHGPFRDIPANLIGQNYKSLEFSQVYNFGKPVSNTIVRCLIEIRNKYSIVKNDLKITSRVSNFDTIKKFPSNFALHPYFPWVTSLNEKLNTAIKVSIASGNRRFVINQGDIISDGRDYLNLDPKGETVEFAIREYGKVKIKTRGFGYLLIWTDNIKYICFEPIQCKPQDFLRSDVGSFINPGQTKTFTCSFSFDFEL